MLEVCSYCGAQVTSLEPHLEVCEALRDAPHELPTWRGLSNNLMELNCFLNSCIQAL